jgi:hypothetical protein
MTEVLATQAQQTGDNTVIVTDTLGNIGGGQIGDGTNGTGDSYVGRLLIIDQNTASEQIRLCSVDAAGTGTTRILTVNEDWDVNPVITTDTIYVAYELADIEDGGAGGGIGLSSKSGLWELSNTLEVISTGILQGLAGQGMELDDQGATYAFQVQSGGFFYAGYENAGAFISGIQITSYNNSAGEASTEVLSGGHMQMYDTLIWAQLVPQFFDVQDGAEGVFVRCKWLATTEELILYNSDITDSSVSGRGGTTEIVRIDVDTVVNGLVLADIDTLDCRADTVTETFTLSGVQFVGVTDFLNVRNNKTWEMIDPIWPVTVYTQFVWVGSTANEVNDRTSVTAIVKESDGTLLQDALVIIYEDTFTGGTLVLELVSDADGLAADSFLYLSHVTNSATNTYGGHALRVDKWTYFPFISTQSSTDKFLGEIVMGLDSQMVATVQATAITAGGAGSWEEDTNPSTIMDATNGSGTLAAGETVTGGTSGATGVMIRVLDGRSDTAATFTISLKTRNATAWTDGEALSNGSGWTANYTAATFQDFSIRIQGDRKTIQVIYDFWAAKSSETTLSADGTSLHEWGRDQQARPITFTGGNNWLTHRSYGKGILLDDHGTGTPTMTDDLGNTWAAPVTVNLEITVQDKADQLPIQDAQTSIYLVDSPFTELMNEDTTAAGLASAAYIYAGDIDVVVKSRKSEDTDNPRYFAESQVAEITATGLTLTLSLEKNPFLN